MVWIAGAALTGMLVTIVIQPAPSPVPVWSEVTITPLNQRDPKAQGSQVRLIRVVNHDRRLPLSLFERDGDWQLLDDGVVMLAPTGASGSLRWSGWVRGALRVYCVVCFSALAYLLLGYTMRCFRALSRRDQRVRIACSVLAGMIAVVVMPPVPLPLWVWSEVTITSLNQRDPEWQGSEVWLLRAFNGGRRLSLTEFEDDGIWVMGNNGELIAPGVYGTLRWRGWVHRALDLEFLRHPWSGRVRVTINGRTYDIVNSYSKPRVWPDAWRETLTPVSNVSSRSHEAFLFRVADWISSSAVVLAGAVVFVARRVRR